MNDNANFFRALLEDSFDGSIHIWSSVCCWNIDSIILGVFCIQEYKIHIETQVSTAEIYLPGIPIKVPLQLDKSSKFFCMAGDHRY